MAGWQATIGVVAGFLSILCFVPYIVTILQGKTKPNRATWWIWVILSTVISASYYSSGAGNTIWLPVCGGIGQLIVAILSLKHGEGGWSRFDRLCLLGVGISLLLWWQFNSPLIALLLNILIDFLGALPTIKKSYYEPQTENLLTWILYLAASTLNLFAIESWSFTLSAFPLYIFFINTTIVIFLLRNKLQAYNLKKHRILKKINFM
ncbi:hypothetical protein H6G76_19575 [Nostoc sp. FACHB-152]|uniref:hypothetical protein n=1 Tax=unclassified Nostoc TaxID=2593658 RepID=UPI00168236CB|nr:MULTISPECIES: hypothetical protein [unclassified Nostoc]MBD2449319.1 hypothetical protein [Nostoc sp. FACHB-152]MBD2470513.1 hypothetical protein [Nostoc sp. FACHB-145]